MAPDIVKPAPVKATELMVTGAVPLEVKVTDFVIGVFNAPLPKARAAVLTLKVGVQAFNCKAKLLLTEFAEAVRVAVWAEVTAEMPAANVVLVVLAGTVTEVGTTTAALLLDKLTLRPPLGAAELSVTVQASDAAPVMDALLHESAVSVPAGPRLYR